MYQSKGLRDFAVKYATKLSYNNVSELIREVCKGTTLSDQHIHKLVKMKADEITHEQKEKIAKFETSEAILEAIKTDIYSQTSEEVVYLSDDVCVKAQKEKRDKHPKTKGKEKQEKQEKQEKTKGKRYNTRISMFEDSLGGYKTIVAGLGVNNVQLVKAVICQEYPLKSGKLPVVAITDGATSIKNELKTIFGENFTHILD